MRSPIGGRLASLLGYGRSVGGGPTVRMSEREFREYSVQTLRKLAPGVKVELTGPLELRFSRGEFGPWTSSLNNAYRAYLQAPDALELVLSHYLKTATDLLEPETPPSLDNLVILVRTPADMDEIGRRVDEATRPLAADMIEVLAVDRPTSFWLPRADKIVAAVAPWTPRCGTAPGRTPNC